MANLSSAAWYDTRVRKAGTSPAKPGPKPALSDQKILQAVQAYLRDPTFTQEGYIKIRSRLADQGVTVGKNRLYRLMRQANLLLPTRASNACTRVHDGTIITLAPNQMWATDGKEFRTKAEGKCWFMGVIDHFNDQILSFFLSTKFDTWAAIEPLRMAVKEQFKSLEKNVCLGTELTLRADHGSQYDSKKFQHEIQFLGLKYSPAFVRSPECNGIIERFHRTLNEQVFSLVEFDNLEQAHQHIQEFISKYNQTWKLHRLGLVSPIQYKQAYLNQQKADIK